MDSGNGLLGFLVVVALLATAWVLFRSMSTRLANVRRNAPHWPGNESPPDDEDPAAG